jgi:hypothetical protein
MQLIEEKKEETEDLEEETQCPNTKKSATKCTTESLYDDNR